MTRLRRGVRRARRAVWLILAALLVAMALVSGAVSQLLPLAERHPDRVAAWLGARAGRTIAFDGLQTAWTRRGPLLRVDSLRIGDGAQAVTVGNAEILVAQYAGLLPGRSFTELRVRGLDLVLERDAAGRWQVRGLPGEAQGGDPLRVLEGLGELQVIGARLRVLAPSVGVRAELPRVDLRLRVDGGRVRAAARAWVDADSAPLDGVVDFRRDSGDGRAWLSLPRADLSAWRTLGFAGIAPDAGRGRIAGWADLRAHRVVAVAVDAALEGVVLRGAPLTLGDGSARVPRESVGAVALQARWTTGADGWTLAARRLRLGDGADAQRLDGLSLAGGRRQAASVSRVELGPLLTLVGMSDRIPAPLRRWIMQARPGGQLLDVELVRSGSALHVAARAVGIRFDATGGTPGVSGIAGIVAADARGFAFSADPVAAVRVAWPGAFSGPHMVRLAGDVTGWRDGGETTFATPSLRIAGDGYGFGLRGDATFAGDGTRPVLQLAIAADDAPIATARRFWLRDRMPPKAVEWLDRALVTGTVRDGRVLLSGDLDDWPFRADRSAGSGVFAADAAVQGVQLKFLPDWPATDTLDGRVAFTAEGFLTEGDAVLAGVPIQRFSGGIERFGKSGFAVEAESAGDAAPLLALLRASPLRGTAAETLDSLVATGPVQARFALVLPFSTGLGAPARISGDVVLDGATLADPRWDLAFDEVSGRARYDGAGFTADTLRARRDGQPATLDLRAGRGHVRDPRLVFEGALTTSLTARELLARAPRLGWLGDEIDGRSPWTVAVAVPTAVGATRGLATRLQLDSRLVGTRLRLPAPLDKPMPVALPTRVDLQLPIDGGEVAVTLGGRLALRSRSVGARTGVRVVLGGGAVIQAPPATGLVVGGRTPTLDAIGWAALVGAIGSASGADAASAATDTPFALQRLDVLADRLLLLGGAFPATRVVASGGNGTAITLSGPALAGSVRVPADGGVVDGRLQRVHWRSADAASPVRRSTAGAATRDDDAARQAADGVTPVLPQGVAAADEMDPARIPPLLFTVEDLRVGDVALGAARLRTRATAAGMAIDELSTRAPGQRIDASGGWTGRGRQSQTRLSVDVNSGDVGALLSGVGFGGRIQGGSGDVRFAGRWPGSPASFSLGTIAGELALALKDGQLVEIEPGAGRMLGLLSIAELPRRLTLDFRDLFSRGFRFSSIGGTVQFADGRARSDDLVIDGPAAEIRIGGAADLRARAFDQTIVVLPKTANLLTAVGAITAGPVGAAIGAMANAVLRRPLGDLGAKIYRVTGPWTDPQVDVATRAPAAAPAAEDEAPRRADAPVPAGGSAVAR